MVNRREGRSPGKATLTVPQAPGSKGPSQHPCPAFPPAGGKTQCLLLAALASAVLPALECERIFQKVQPVSLETKPVKEGSVHRGAGALRSNTASGRHGGGGPDLFPRMSWAGETRGARAAKGSPSGPGLGYVLAFQRYQLVTCPSVTDVSPTERETALSPPWGGEERLGREGALAPLREQRVWLCVLPG